MMSHLFDTMQMIGWAIVVNVIMEAYHARRTSETLGEYERGLE
jgi:hypothetical protein